MRCQLLGLALSAVQGAPGYDQVPAVGSRPELVPGPKVEAIIGHLAESSPKTEDTTLRFLQGGQPRCSVTAIFKLFPAEPVRRFQQCMLDHEADTGKPGAKLHAQSECWCEHNITDFVKPQGCCEDPLDVECSIDCSPNCQSAEARECMNDCPALCLDASYAPDSCAPTAAGGCNFTKCFPHILCITDAAQQGAVDVCDFPKLEADSKVTDYLTCMDSFSHRSLWKHMNAARHCACSADFAETLRTHGCCSHPAFEGVCGYDCTPQPSCESQEATTCISECETTCTYLNPAPSTECRTQCMNNDATCNKFAVCRPSGLPNHTYVCDDGTEPHASGCCLTTLPRTCPAQCSGSVVHRLTGSATNHFECECTGCPAPQTLLTEEEVSVLRAQLEEVSSYFLWQVSRLVGLEGPPSDEMEDLVKEYTAEIENLYKTIADEEERAAKLRDLESKYSALIVEAARQAVREREQDSPTVAEPVVNTQITDATTGQIIVGFDVNLCITNLGVVSPCREIDSMKFVAEAVSGGIRVLDSSESSAMQPGTLADGSPVFFEQTTDTVMTTFLYDANTRHLRPAGDPSLCVSADNGVLRLHPCRDDDPWQRLGGPAPRIIIRTRVEEDEGTQTVGIILIVVAVVLVIPAVAAVIFYKKKLKATQAAGPGATPQYGPEVVVGRAVEATEVPPQGVPTGAAEVTTGKEDQKS
mmetsp:Transcript_99191/g.265271  ORF Transcript_99191/g.265271 Transcript_99191/m.265271 type:complete len:699 (+) Transcript_99191:35-2131(+)